MNTQLRMYLAGTIAALSAFLFVSLAFSGEFNFLHGGVFVVFFIVVMVAFANVVKWADSLESNLRSYSKGVVEPRVDSNWTRLIRRSGRQHRHQSQIPGHSIVA